MLKLTYEKIMADVAVRVCSTWGKTWSQFQNTNCIYFIDWCEMTDYVIKSLVFYVFSAINKWDKHSEKDKNWWGVIH